MPTPTKGARMGGSAAHQRHLLSNLATALFEHGKITTTEARARRLRPYAERLITFAKRGDLSARRQVLTVVTDKSVVHTLFTEIGPQFATREGGYTRITKIGPRKGDNAPLAVIELIQEEAEAKPRRRRARRSQPAARPAASAAARRRLRRLRRRPMRPTLTSRPRRRTPTSRLRAPTLSPLTLSLLTRTDSAAGSEAADSEDADSAEAPEK